MTSRATLLALVAVASPVLAVVGCDYYVLGSPSDTSNPTVDNLASIDGGDAAVEAGLDDAHAPATSGGSPLCGASNTAASTMSCNPDNPTTATACDIAPDAQAGYPNAALACRIVAADGANTASGLVQPVCAAAGTGGDGAWCKASSECAPAYDCVGAGTCQRYCCSGNVECVASEFCDIQPTTQTTGILIPVCMPIQPAAGCELLPDPSAPSCPMDQTCSVVRENGATSCVAVGAATAGDECDDTHCQAGLVCIGTPGQRRCYQLCHTNAAGVGDCSTTQQQTCKGGLPLFPDPSIGICQ
jgi:hypothetical protein